MSTAEQVMTGGKQLSRIGLTNKRSASVRTIIPQRIAETLHLKVDDVVEWETFEKKGQILACFKRLE
jgi:hypothetical protein